MVHILDIEDVFSIEGRGLVLAALWVPSCEEEIHNGDKVELRAKSGERLRTNIKAIEMISALPTSDGRVPIALMMADILPTTIGTRGTEVWKLE